MGELTVLLADLFRMSNADITDDLSLKTTAVWDSLKHMELVASLEKKFGIRLTADEIVSMISVGEIKRVLKTRGIEDSK